MGTLTITAAGFASLGASPPANWPSNVVFPAGGNPNGTKTVTVNDADWLQLLTWVAASQTAELQTLLGVVQQQGPGGGAPAAPLTPTAQQILLAWLAIWFAGTKTAVQQFNVTPPTVPPPISIA